MAPPRPVASAVTDEELAPIPATAWAVLGILSFGREMSGYDIKQWADAILRFFYWSPATSQIYTEVRRLERLGLVTSRTVARDGAREKTIYAITPDGTAALERWQAEVDAEAPVVKDALLLRVWLGHLAEPARLREQVETHRARLLAELDDARESLRGSEGHPGWEYPALVVEWTCRRIEAELALADLMLDDLTRLTPPAPTD